MNTQQIQLRAAQIEDTDTVLHILSSSRMHYLPYAVSPHSLESQRRWVSNTLVPTNNVTIACLDNEDLGVIAASSSEQLAWINQLYISPGHTGRGLGSELLKFALGNLPRPVRLWVFQENKNARRFYEHHGFVAIAFTDGQTNEEKCPDVLYELT